MCVYLGKMQRTVNMFAIPGAWQWHGFLFSQSIYWYYYFRRVNWSIHICIVCTLYRSLLPWQILIFSFAWFFFLFFRFVVWKESVRKEFSRSFFLLLLSLCMFFFTCISLALISPSQTNAFFLLWFLSKYTTKKVESKDKKGGRLRARCPLSKESPVNNCWYLYSVNCKWNALNFTANYLCLCHKKQKNCEEKKQNQRKKKFEYNRRKTSSLLIIVSFSCLFSEKFLRSRARTAKTSAGTSGRVSGVKQNIQLNCMPKR